MVDNWLNRRFRAGTVYVMGVEYVVKHLRLEDRPQILGSSQEFRKIGDEKRARMLEWQESKEPAIERLLDSEDIDPIVLCLHPSRESFVIDDGVTRLRVFRRRGIEMIRVELHYAADFDEYRYHATIFEAFKKDY